MPRTTPNSAISRVLSGLLLLVLVTTCTIGLAASPASAQSAADESALFAATNQSRADNGLPALQYDPQLSSIANAWANHMASTRTLEHNPSLVDQVNSQVTSQWTRIGENVGFGPSVSALESAFMNSPPHRANILGQYNRVGVGATRDSSGTLWAVVDFAQGPPIAPSDPPGTVHQAAWYLRSTPQAGAPDFSFAYGLTSYKFVSGDWDGSGTASIGVFSNGSWYLRNSNSGGSPDISFAYGAPGYTPLVGDWDGDGKDTIGVYTNGWFYLRNSNTPGPPDIVVNYGAPGYAPVVGDWNGDGKDTIGVYTNGWWYLRNLATGGSPDVVVNYGAPGYTPLVGDWNGDGVDTIGVYTNGWWYLRNLNSGGPANTVINYGAAGYTPVVGHWGSAALDGIGVIIPG
ncbi:MAG: lysyl endopeptidase [Acidimicrobiaceae bacterium]|jgi:uncharacterized protein YkwD